MEDKLDGWGEIANYIARSVRTAQRWHRELALPVHRLRGSKGNIVYAHRSEIERWLATRAMPEVDAVGGARHWPWRRRLAGLVASVAIVVAGLLVWYPDAIGVVSSPPAVGMVVYTRVGPDGTSDVFITTDDGLGVEVQLTRHPADDQHPAISPDGTKIAFSSDRDGGRAQVFVMNVDGSNVVQLTELDHPGVRSFEGIDWHPRGDKLVFSAPPPENDGWRHLYEVRADGSELTQLTQPLAGTAPTFLLHPRYSYDGSLIFVSVYPPYRGDISEIGVFHPAFGLMILTDSRDNRQGRELRDGDMSVPIYAKLIDRASMRGSIYKRLPDGREIPLLLGAEPVYYDSQPTPPRGPGATSHPGEFVFQSNRDGATNMWHADLETGVLRQVTFKGANSPYWWVPGTG